VDICREIAVGETLWGVATWEAIDPRIDWIQIFVQGLTNAYRWKDEPGAYQKGAPLGTGRQLAKKTLRLTFWRPGDEFFINDREIRYGLPGQVDYEWVYRLTNGSVLCKGVACTASLASGGSRTPRSTLH